MLSISGNPEALQWTIQHTEEFKGTLVVVWGGGLRHNILRGGAAVSSYATEKRVALYMVHYLYR